MNKDKANYVINLKNGKDCNPEYGLEEKAMRPIECDGFLLLTVEDGKLGVESIIGMDVVMLKNIIINGGESASFIRQACAIAEGELKAYEIFKDWKKKSMKEHYRKGLMEIISMLSEDGDDPE